MVLKNSQLLFLEDRLQKMFKGLFPVSVFCLHKSMRVCVRSPATGATDGCECWPLQERQVLFITESSLQLPEDKLLICRLTKVLKDNYFGNLWWLPTKALIVVGHLTQQAF